MSSPSDGKKRFLENKAHWRRQLIDNQFRGIHRDVLNEIAKEKEAITDDFKAAKILDIDGVSVTLLVPRGSALVQNEGKTILQNLFGRRLGRPKILLKFKHDGESDSPAIMKPNPPPPELRESCEYPEQPREN